MASIIIRRLEDSTKKRLRMRASQHGRSMEEEAREILRTALAGKGGRAQDLAQAIRRRFAALGGVELKPAPREPMREPPRFGR
ncbi:MAG: plasmid stabilization protein [Acidobacteriia bacterium]|nr:plasmid stabilization protein [Terriglobia bacterium]